MDCRERFRFWARFGAGQHKHMYSRTHNHTAYARDTRGLPSHDASRRFLATSLPPSTTTCSRLFAARYPRSPSAPSRAPETRQSCAGLRMSPGSGTCSPCSSKALNSPRCLQHEPHEKRPARAVCTQLGATRCRCVPVRGRDNGTMANTEAKARLDQSRNGT